MVKQVVRNYIYYSDAKIGELAQQLPVPWWQRALNRVSGFGASVAGTGANLNLRDSPPEPVLSTLQKVWRYLEAEGVIGTFDEPKQYVYGKLVFYYGTFDNPPVFFLVGSTERTIVALGGSKKHVRGQRDQQIRASENTHNVTMEPEVATLLYAASEIGSSREPIAIPTADTPPSWAIYVANMYKNWQFWEGRTMEFEV